MKEQEVAEKIVSAINANEDMNALFACVTEERLTAIVQGDKKIVAAIMSKLMKRSEEFRDAVLMAVKEYGKGNPDNRVD